VSGFPGNPLEASALAIARGVCRHREQPSPQIRRIAAGAQVIEELHERFLEDIFSIVVVPQHRPGEAIHRRAVLLEELSRLRRRSGPTHCAVITYNADDDDL
jgi:hypothetical protein